jgi:hypothetical protein
MRAVLSRCFLLVAPPNDQAAGAVDCQQVIAFDNRNKQVAMWKKLSIYVLIALAPTIATEASAQCQTDAHLSCAVYNTCFDKYCPCENTNDGYFIRYGKKYCDRFLGSTGWSAKGNSWRDKTLFCLQQRIAPKLSIVANPTCDCKTMKQFAFQTHVECYTQPGASVCQLELSDYKKIYDIIDVTDDLFRDPYGRKQMRDVLSICKKDQNSTLPPGAIDLIIRILDKLQ